jgi:hypothetical protein
VSDGNDNDTVNGFALVVAWPRTRAWEVRNVRTRRDVEHELRRVTSFALERVQQANQVRTYQPGSIQADNEVFSVPIDQDIDASLVEGLRDFRSKGDYHPEDLPKSIRPTCFALILEDAERQRIFIRKANPIITAHPKFRAIMQGGALAVIDEPLFAFDGSIDAIVEGDRIFVLNQKNFESLFRDSEVIRERAQLWVEDLLRPFPVSGTSIEYLKARASSGLRVRQRVLAIIRLPHMANMTAARFQAALQHEEIPLEDYFQGDELVVTAENEDDFLKILSEYLYRGYFSGRRMEADGARPRAGQD